MPAQKLDLHVFRPGACCAFSRAPHRGAQPGPGLQVPGRAGVGLVLTGLGLFLVPRWSFPDPQVPL